MKKIEKEMTGDVTEHLNRIRHEFVDQIWKRLFLIALICAPISVSRALVTGWLPFYSIQIVLACVAIMVVILLRKLSFAVKTGALLMLLWSISLPGIITFGVVATSIWWLVLSCVIASIIVSVRMGAILAVAGGVVLAIAGYGFVSGALTYSMDINAYLTQPVAWIALVMSAGVFVFVVIQSISTYNRSIVGLLHEVRVQRDHIQHLAMHDDLTGLPLNSLAEDRIRVAFHSARRRKKMVALLFIDLDGFKSVNDTWSHEAGNVVLKELANRILGAIRAEDTAARIGGDEFLVILGDLSSTEDAVQLAQRIIDDIAVPIAYRQHTIIIGASIGISLFPDHSEEVKVLLQIADAAMYSAKKAGKNGYALGSRDAVTVQSTPVSGTRR